MASENFVARRSETLDAENISEMVSRQTEGIFGRTDVEMVIEYANLSITLVGVESGEILGHMALMDYPSVTSVDQDAWEEWIHTHFKVPAKSTPINSLYIHLFVAKEGFAQAAAAELLRASFMTIPILQYVFLTTSAGQNLGSGLGYHMEGVAKCSISDGPGNGPVTVSETDLYVAHRHEHFPMLHVRVARVEDTDDLMPIFTQSSEAGVDKQYGEFFLAELIESQDKHHKTVVADVNGIAVGFLSVTSVVDVDHLNASYQLESFHGLKQADDRDETYTISTSGSKVSSSTTITSSLQSTAADTASKEKLEKEQSTTPPHVLTAPTASGPDHEPSGSSSASLQELQNTSQASSQEAPKCPSAGSQASISAKDIEGTSSAKHLTSGSGLVQEARPGTPTVGSGMLGSQDSAAGSTTSASQKSQSAMLPSHDPNIAKQVSATSDNALASQKGSTASMRLTDGSKELIESPSATQGKAPAHSSTSTAAKKASKKHYVFKGAGNALAVQLFAIDEKYEMRSRDLLPMVFQLFPDHDFLVLSQPHSLPEFPLLTQFTRILPRPGVVVPQDLYALHKFGLLHNFSVRPCRLSDVEGLTKLASELSGSADLLLDTRRYLEARRDPLTEGSTPLSVLVAECSNQLVGVCILRDEEDIRYLRTHYNIEYFVYFDYHPPSSHAHLHHFILNPVFHSYAKFFIKECLRLSHKSCLYYPLYPDIVSEQRRPHSIITALTHMVPIKARPQIEYEMKSLDINCPLDDVVQKKPAYALYHTNRKLAFEPKIHVNSRVVVVGASDTAISFLETLLFSPHLHFTNLTLLTPHSFPAPESFAAAPFFRGGRRGEHPHHMTSYTMSYTKNQYDLLGLNTWVNTVRGKLVALDRPEQCVYVDCEDHSCVLYYDYLVLCMGTQYLPSPDLGSHLYRQSNIFTVNDAHDKGYFYQWIKTKYIHSITDNIVICGNNLDAFSVVQAVLDFGVAPDNIVLACQGKCSICPVPKANDILMGAMNRSGVRVVDEVCLKHCEVREGKLTSLYFSKEGEENTLVLTAQALVYVDQKAIDPEAFKALNDACLVMDRRLMINTNHETNDPLIFAAGPLTKFSRRYRAEQWSHANYNSKEVGERLASTMLSRLDPTLGYYESEDTAPSDTDAIPVYTQPSDTLPVYTQPKATAAYLPGGYHYLHVHTPVSSSTERQTNATSEAVAMSTDTDSGFVYLHLDQYGRVDELVAISQEPLLAAHNYLCLYHVHEKYINNLVQRWKDGLIEDFFKYFKEPWACAIFHDRFVDLVDELNEHLQTAPLEDGKDETLHSLVEQLVTEDNARSRVSQEDVLPAFNKSHLGEDIEKKLYKFLAYNINHLPVYISPDYYSMKTR